MKKATKKKATKKKAAAKKKKITKKVSPKKSADIPVTAAMLKESHYELSRKISANAHSIKALEKKMDSKFSVLESKMDAKFYKVLAEVHRIGLLVEEQNARNKYVLDGYTSLSDRMDKLENKVLKENL